MGSHKLKRLPIIIFMISFLVTSTSYAEFNGFYLGQGFGTSFDKGRFSMNKKGDLYHFRWGAGLEYQFLCNWGAQFLFTHTDYGKLHFKGSGSDVGGDEVSLSSSTTFHTKLSKKTFSLGFVRYY